MKCDVVSDNLLRYSEGALGAWDAAKVRLHVARCESCKRRLTVLSESGRNIAEAMHMPVDAPDLVDAVMASLGAAPRRAVRFRARWVVTPVAACALIAVLAMLNHPVAPVKPKHAPRGFAATPRPSIQEKHAVRHSPVKSIRGYGEAKQHGRIARSHRPRNRPKQLLVVRKPLLVQAPPPASVSPQSSKIVVVLVRPAEPHLSRVEVQTTNQITGATTHYSATYDEEGNQQSMCMADTAVDQH